MILRGLPAGQLLILGAFCAAFRHTSDTAESPRSLRTTKAQRLTGTHGCVIRAPEERSQPSTTRPLVTTDVRHGRQQFPRLPRIDHHPAVNLLDGSLPRLRRTRLRELEGNASNSTAN